MARVLHPGGVLTGSALLNDTGLRYLAVRRAGRLAGLLGPSTTTSELGTWLRASGFIDVEISLSGAIGYFRAVKA